MKDQQEEWQVLCGSAAVERDPAKLLKLVQRINELLEQKHARLEGRAFSSVARRGKRIFQIAYDELLLISRAQILKERGYDVTSALGTADAHRVLAKGEKYHIFLIGHAAPEAERQSMVRRIKALPGAKVLALNAPSYGALPEADFNFVQNGPEEGLATIAREAA